MKLEMELVRSVLLKLEESPEATWEGVFEIEGHSPEEVSYHVMMLNEGGLIKAIDLSGGRGSDWFPERLTWDGHEFLANAKNDVVWSKFKAAASTAGGMSVKIAEGLLLSLAKQQWGLS